MDRLKKKYAKLFQAAEEHVKEWNVERSIVEALVNNVANLLARLPVLQQKKLFEGFRRHKWMAVAVDAFPGGEISRKMIAEGALHASDNPNANSSIDVDVL
eukprot:jgi/Pico_ML_1/51999/g2781.t1